MIDHDSEERAVPVSQMASLSEFGYRKIAGSERSDNPYGGNPTQPDDYRVSVEDELAKEGIIYPEGSISLPAYLHCS